MAACRGSLCGSVCSDDEGDAAAPCDGVSRSMCSSPHSPKDALRPRDALRHSLLALFERQNRRNCAESVRRASMPDYKMAHATASSRVASTPSGTVSSVLSLARSTKAASRAGAFGGSTSGNPSAQPSAVLAPASSQAAPHAPPPAATPAPSRLSLAQPKPVIAASSRSNSLGNQPSHPAALPRRRRRHRGSSDVHLHSTLPTYAASTYGWSCSSSTTLPLTGSPAASVSSLRPCEAALRPCDSPHAFAGDPHGEAVDSGAASPSCASCGDNADDVRSPATGRLGLSAGCLSDVSDATLALNQKIAALLRSQSSTNNVSVIRQRAWSSSHSASNSPSPSAYSVESSPLFLPGAGAASGVQYARPRLRQRHACPEALARPDAASTPEAGDEVPDAGDEPSKQPQKQRSAARAVQEKTRAAPSEWGTDSAYEGSAAGDCDAYSEEDMNRTFVGQPLRLGGGEEGGEAMCSRVLEQEPAPSTAGDAELEACAPEDASTVMLSCALSLLHEYEEYKRSVLVAGWRREVNDRVRRHEDEISLLFASQSLIRGVEMQHGACTPASATVGLSAAALRPFGSAGPSCRRSSNASSARPSKTPTTMAHSLASLAPNAVVLGKRDSRFGTQCSYGDLNRSKSVCGGSCVRSSSNVGLNTTNTTFVELSSTQATLVVKDDEGDDREGGVEGCVPSWADCLDASACLTRNKAVQNVVSNQSFNQPHLSATPPLMGYPREPLEVIAERERLRMERELRRQLFTYVADDDPKAVMDLTLDRHNEPVSLGTGSYGSVYHATMRATAEELAIKMVQLDQLENGAADLRDVVLNEIVILSSFAHPNIVTYHGTYFHQPANELWCVMECCKGHSLFDLLHPAGGSQRILKDFEIVKVCTDVLSALGYLCGKGYIHRDVKPENVLSDGRSLFKLSDFGLSRFCSIDEEHKSSSIEGTLQYLAPEGFQDLRGLITGVPQCSTSHRGDIYSFGVCVLQMAGIDVSRSIGRPETYRVPPFDPSAFGPKRTDLSKRLSSLLFDFTTHCLKDDVKLRPTADMLLKYAYAYGVVHTAPFTTGMTSSSLTRQAGFALILVSFQKDRSHKVLGSLCMSIVAVGAQENNTSQAAS